MNTDAHKKHVTHHTSTLLVTLLERSECLQRPHFLRLVSKMGKASKKKARDKRKQAPPLNTPTFTLDAVPLPRCGMQTLEANLRSNAIK